MGVRPVPHLHCLSQHACKHHVITHRPPPTQAVRNGVGAELDAAVSRALEGRVEITRLQAAEARASRAEREAARLARELQTLQGALAEAQAQVCGDL